jgi:hypothetical protein
VPVIVAERLDCGVSGIDAADSGGMTAIGALQAIFSTNLCDYMSGVTDGSSGGYGIGRDLEVATFAVTR